jgi:hypothetical protein
MFPGQPWFEEFLVDISLPIRYNLANTGSHGGVVGELLLFLTEFCHT